MKNRRFMPILGLLVMGTIGACEVEIYNNSPYLVSINDLNTQKNSRLIPFFTKTLSPIDGKRVHFQVTVYKKFGLEPIAFELKQTSCFKSSSKSSDEKIALTIKNILDQNLGKYEKIFDIKTVNIKTVNQKKEK